MNREEIFRGKLSHSGEWVFGSLLKIGSHYHIVTESDMHEDGHHICQESDTPTWVDPDTVGEFTGMKDKHGNKVFEGDIVEYGRSLYVCEFVEGGFAFRDISDDRLTLNAILIEAEVIGNRYDNPELLEKKE